MSAAPLSHDRALDSTTRAGVAMGTIVTMRIAHHGPARDPSGRGREAALDAAFSWFVEVERRCSRFDPASELRALTARVGEAVAVSPMLFAAVEFAVAVAAETDGAFDPTVGRDLEQRGFDTDYRTRTAAPTTVDAAGATYRDVTLGAGRGTVRLERPLLLDLGAVAKGLAIDMAARELEAFEHFAIDAGGDVFVAGHGPDGRPWSVGIRHPRHDDLLGVVRVSNAAVCTSGDYERPGGSEGHHVVDGRTRRTALAAVSATTIAPTALAADALATAAFVLGPAGGIALLERHGVDGLIVASDLTRHVTAGFDRHA
ncbi:MAG: FAD:protein FMN transferase [Acidobacteria bacterium]|nr:FAD:protein FMN transferase [Acidobacteriota bacterium]